jgi:hypothetical protein
MYYMKNLGTLNLAFHYYIGATFLMLYYAQRRKKSIRADRKYKKLKKMLVYDFIIETIKESYASMAVCSFISL